MTTLNQCDNFAIWIDASAGGDPSAAFPSTQFTNVSVSGGYVSGTYIGTDPYVVPANFSYTPPGQYAPGVSHKAFIPAPINYPVISSSVTGQSKSGVCAFQKPTGATTVEINPPKVVKTVTTTTTTSASASTGMSTTQKVLIGVAATAAVGGLGYAAWLYWGAGAVATEAREDRPSMHVQTILFPRDEWTETEAKRWLRDHGYKSSKVHATNQYLRFRQESPRGKKVLRTVPFGHSGIRAVVAR